MFFDIDQSALYALDLHGVGHGMRIQQDMYIRAYSGLSGLERRYVADRSGAVYYKLQEKRHRRGAIRAAVFRSLDDEIGSCTVEPFHEGGIRASLDLCGKRYHAGASAGKARKGCASWDRQAFVIRTAGNGLSFTLHGRLGKVAEAASVFTEMGWSPANQDVYFPDDPEWVDQAEPALLMLASLSLLYSCSSFVFGD